MNTKKLKVLFPLILGVSLLLAQPSRLDSVITKFRSDNRSFEEFIVLGRAVCYGDIALLPIRTEEGFTDLYSGMHGKILNSLTPLSRLLDEDSVKKSLDEYLALNKKRFDEFYSQKEWDNISGSNYYKLIKLCDCLFDNNDDFKKQYLKLINNRKNYNDMRLRGMKSFMKEYLDTYFILSILEPGEG